MKSGECCISDIMMAYRKFDTRFRTLTYLLRHHGDYIFRKVHV